MRKNRKGRKEKESDTTFSQKSITVPSSHMNNKIY